MRTSMLRQTAAVLCVAALGVAFPTHIYKQATSPGAFIGEGINNIATALLQDTEKQGNAAFSPLGHSAILAALAEGASGRTRAQLLAALKLPQDSSLTRATYRSVLGRMKERNPVSKPEFRSWFYVYKKSAQVEESYTNMLRDHFLMEVRDIDAVESDTPTEFFTQKEQEVEGGDKPCNGSAPTLDENNESAALPPADPAAVHSTTPSIEDQKGPQVEPQQAEVQPQQQAQMKPQSESQQAVSEQSVNEKENMLAASAPSEDVTPVKGPTAETPLPETVSATDAPAPAPNAPPADAPDAEAEGPAAVAPTTEAPSETPSLAETALVVDNAPPILDEPLKESEVIGLPVPIAAELESKPEGSHDALSGESPLANEEQLPQKQMDPIKTEGDTNVPAEGEGLPVKMVSDESSKQESSNSSENADKETAPATAGESFKVDGVEIEEPVAAATETDVTPEKQSQDAEMKPVAQENPTGEAPTPASATEGSVISSEVNPGASSEKEVPPMKEIIVPPTELLPPMENIAKDESVKVEDVQKAEGSMIPIEESKPVISDQEEPMGTIPAEPQNLNPANELHKDDAVEEIAEKTSLAKFSKQGLPKDEKKPTSVSKPDKRKDEKKKYKNAAEADTDGRQPASGPSLLTSFNALYYKGAWQTPFDAKFKDDFSIGEGLKKEVTMLRTQGDFRIGEIKELDARAIELPYKGENGRYSLLVLLPRAPDGLSKLTEALSRFSFRQLGKNMRQKHVDVTLPEFEIDCISHPQNVFRKLGVTAMLDKEIAEFPGISKTKRLYLQDDAMAQLVRFRLDDETAVANYLSTMSMSTRSGNQVFQANHPFIFYLRDNLDNLTIVVGKVVDPSIRPEFSDLDSEE